MTSYVIQCGKKVTYKMTIAMLLYLFKVAPLGNNLCPCAQVLYFECCFGFRFCTPLKLIACIKQ